MIRIARHIIGWMLLLGSGYYLVTMSACTSYLPICIFVVCICVFLGLIDDEGMILKAVREPSRIDFDADEEYESQHDAWQESEDEREERRREHRREREAGIE